MRLPFDKKKPLFRWGPSPGYFFYTSIFCKVNYKYFCQRYLGENWSETLFLFRKGRMVWINDYEALRASGLRVFLQLMLARSRRAKLYREWQGHVKQLEKMYRQLDQIDWLETSNERLLILWQNLHRVYLDFWVVGTVPELGNYGADKYLEEALREADVPLQEITKVLAVLTAPEKPSFYQQEEIDLAVTRDLRQHAHTYFWLKNSYAGPTTLDEKFFVKRKKDLAGDITKELARKFRAVRAAKATVVRKYKLPRRIVDISNAIQDGILWQDERKKYIFITLHYQDMMLNEVARRFGYRKKDLLNLWYDEVDKILRGHKIADLASRRLGFGVNFFKTCRVLKPAVVAYYWRAYAEEQVGMNTQRAVGLVVSRGKKESVRGRVRILLDPLAARAFTAGEILVAPMTSPEYIFAMRRARAIITDAGGLTCHAAIVSRELGVPCIVGTKIATKLFKNGDKVEVDADKGVVKKI